MQPYIQPNAIRPFGGGIIHINANGMQLSLQAVVAEEGGGGGGGGSSLPVIFTEASGFGAGIPIAPIPIPADIAVGDFMLATIMFDSFSAIPFAGADAGWEPIADNEASAPSIQMYWKFAEAEDISAGAANFTAGAAASWLGTIIGVSGVNASDPIAAVNYEPDTLNQLSNFDPNSTTLRYYGRTSFGSQPGPRAIATIYDNSLAVSAWALDGNQMVTTNGHQNLSGYTPVHKHRQGSTQAAMMGQYPMPNIGIVPATTMFQMTSDDLNGVTLILNPETLASGTLPTGCYIVDIAHKYLSSSTQPITVRVPSGILAGDKIIMIAAEGSNGAFTNDTCVDDVDGATGWTRKLRWFDTAKGWNIWEKTAGGTEATVTYDSNRNAFQKATLLCVRNATSGILAGIATSGASVPITGTSIIGPSVELNADGTIVVHAAQTKGTSNNNLCGDWAQFGIANPDQAGQDVSGIVVMPTAGSSTDIGHAIGQTPNATGSGVLAPKWNLTASAPLAAIAFSIY